MTGFKEVWERGKRWKYDQRLDACQVKAKSWVRQIRSISSRSALPSVWVAFSSSLVCTSSSSCEWCGHPAEAVSPWDPVWLHAFPAKQCHHDMWQRVVGTISSRPARPHSENIQDLEQIMIINIFILGIMDNHTYKTQNLMVLVIHFVWLWHWFKMLIFDF